jgi:hypothetical protein
MQQYLCNKNRFTFILNYKNTIQLTLAYSAVTTYQILINHNGLFFFQLNVSVTTNM